MQKENDFRQAVWVNKKNFGSKPEKGDFEKYLWQQSKYPAGKWMCLFCKCERNISK